MIPNKDKLSLYAPQGVTTLVDVVTRIVAPYGAKELVSRASADGAMSIYEWEMEQVLSRADRLQILRSLLPQVRESGQAICLKSSTRQAIKRIVADLDGTLVGGELLVQLVGGQAEEQKMKRETERAMSGACLFEENFRARVRHLAGLGATRLEEMAYEMPLARGAELLGYFIQGEELRFDLASSNLTPYVHNLAIRFNAHEYIATMPLLESDNETLTGLLVDQIIGPNEKRSFVEHDPYQRVTADGVLSIGDGANDLEMLASAGHALLYVADHTQALNIAHVCTDVYFQ